MLKSDEPRRIQDLQHLLLLLHHLDALELDEQLFLEYLHGIHFLCSDVLDQEDLPECTLTNQLFELKLTQLDVTATCEVYLSIAIELSLLLLLLQLLAVFTLGDTVLIDVLFELGVHPGQLICAQPLGRRWLHDRLNLIEL